jgi:hypothetical protein
MYLVGNNYFGIDNGLNRGIWILISTTMFSFAVVDYPVSWEKVEIPNRFGDDQWHMATLVFTSGDSLKGYIDGELVGTNSLSFTSINHASSKLQIGKPHDLESTTAGYIGYLDDIRIYERTLNETEIIGFYSRNKILQTITKTITETERITQTCSCLAPSTITVSELTTPTNTVITSEGYGIVLIIISVTFIVLRKKKQE